MNYSSLSFGIIQLTNRINMLLLRWLLCALDGSQEDSSFAEAEVLGLVAKMLCKIDGSFFGGLQSLLAVEGHSSGAFQAILSRIERYLVRSECKKLNKKLKEDVLQFSKMEQMLGIILYLSIGGGLKAEMIQKMGEFSEQEQMSLMQVYNEINASLEKVVEIREVIEKIQKMEQENSRLRDLCVRQEEKLREGIELNSELQAENTQLQNENSKYREQKAKVRQCLDIYDIPEYLELCQYLKKENEELDLLLNGEFQEKEAAKKLGFSLRAELLSLENIIKSQMEESQKLRNWYEVLSNDEAFQGYIQQEGVTQLVLPLRDNRNYLNLSHSKGSRAKIETDRTQYSTTKDEEEQLEAKNNLSMLLEVNRLQEEEKRKMERVRQLRQQNRKQKKKEKRLTSILLKLRSENQHFAELWLKDRH